MIKGERFTGDDPMIVPRDREGIRAGDTTHSGELRRERVGRGHQAREGRLDSGVWANKEITWGPTVSREPPQRNGG